MEILILGLFLAALILCVVCSLSIVIALTAGLFLFVLYGLLKGYSGREVFTMCLDGVKTIRNILVTFVLVGILTALWRAGGTIPTIVCYAAALITPGMFLLLTFLLNAGVSVLMGTAFGTAATMGVICTTMGAAMQVPLFFVGGAVMAGAYFGDRVSPVSTSALLVAEITGTDIYRNIRAMLRSAVIPFLISCAFYLLLGLFTAHQSASLNLAALYEREFRIHWIALIPALLILLLSCFRVKVKLTMLASVLASVLICLFLQGVSLGELADMAVFGFHAKDAEVAAVTDGGGIVSMLRVIAIVCLSSSYSGIFQKTGLLDPVRRPIEKLAGRITPFGATFVTSVLATATACNQTLAILMTHQLCQKLEPDPEVHALTLEDTAEVVAPLIPWAIGCSAVLNSVGAPLSSIPFAIFLYLLPCWRLFFSLRSRKKPGAVS